MNKPKQYPADGLVAACRKEKDGEYEWNYQLQDIYTSRDDQEQKNQESLVSEVAEEPIPSFRLYIGNLKPNTNEETLRTLFDEHGIEVGSVLVKRTFAFVDCPDQAATDSAIDKLNGIQFSGSEKMQVEPSVGRRRRSNKIQIRNFPTHIGVEEVQELVNSFGLVQKCELVGAEGLVYVTFDTADTAQQAVNRLNGIDFQGSAITVDFASSKTRKKLTDIAGRGPPNMNHPPMHQQQQHHHHHHHQQHHQQGHGHGHGGPGGNAKAPELPLRMIVGSEFIGAIIGRAGQTIHNITTQSRARVDIHRAEHTMTPDTVITIKGSPESCSNACMEILKIVQSEAQALVKGKGPQEQLGSDKDSPLRLLCPNQLCGRIIGKGGSVIKNFMDQSGTHIIVSNAAEGNMYVDRVVTITGPLDNCKQAEQLIGEKMRKCNELDYQNFQNMGMFPPNMGPGGPGGPMGPGFYQGGRGGPPFPPGPYPMGPGMYQGGPGLYNAPQPPQQQLEVYYMYIPEATVGAVIGSKGANIKNIMRLSNARVKILDQNSQGGEKKEQRGRPDEHRKVIITGTPEAQWKAQFYIVEKVRTEIGMPEAEGVQLRSEILVPKSVIGRIIGKGGQNVKEMQRVTGATVRTPDTKAFPDADEVPVTIIGDFYASQSAQRRIRALMLQALQGMRDGPPPPPPGRRMMNGN